MESKKVNCSGSNSSSNGSGSTAASSSSTGLYDTVWECVIPYVQDPRDRARCRWCRLSRRFPQLESLKLKGKPRAAMFNLIDEDWGGYVTPWVEEVIGAFGRMKALHFRRMIVSDADLELLATSRAGDLLEVLKLDKCSGFTTNGLLHIGRFCRNLRTLSMEESTITENDGEWLHQLALNNTVLEHLNFYTTYLTRVRAGDIELIASRCPSLASIKISDCDISDLTGFFRAAASLEEFGGGSFSESPGRAGEIVSNEQLERYASVAFPPRLSRLGLSFLGKAEMPIVYPVASKLKKLDLLFALLDTEGHCQLLQRCPNLEFLEAITPDNRKTPRKTLAPTKSELSFNIWYNGDSLRKNDAPKCGTRM
ncbi:UNVERIFIED_CONTAM: Coronatine-insensitive protein 1 [Sesamum angustifolium]|uniref:Coronatine-insensitive protein 1 n=1 Tax=Sesamum angustifolium TaxID=2727405 RepID=A0AAW2PU06_9LAMI